jgi:heme oxygenase
MLREKLRNETCAYHERIEQKLALTEKVRTKSEYVSLLERFYRFYLPVERRLTHFAGDFRKHSFDLSPRLKSSWIAEDLAKLSNGSERHAAASLCSRIPALQEYASALGCLYVLEGSTLGGQIIARHFNQTLSITRECGGRFFHGYGSDTRIMWNSFVAFLNASALVVDADIVVQAASDTFKSLEIGLCS